MKYWIPLALFSMTAGAMAEEASQPNEPRSEPSAAPQHGQTMDTVRNQFGEPSNARAAVGDPPITRWVYNGFTVYFEHDRVIHAVVHQR